MRTVLFIVCVAASLALGCADSPTELVVAVSTDLAPGSDFTRIEITVTGAEVVPDERLGPVENGTFTRDFDTTDSDAGGRLPFSFGLLPADAMDEAVIVRVRAIDGRGRVVVEQVRSARFELHSIRLLPLSLDLACVGVTFECTTYRGETCAEGVCVSTEPIALDRVAPFHELDGLERPPSIATRLVQRSQTLLAKPVDVGEARGGTFAMGSDELSDVSPVNEDVSVSGFRIDAKEVTIERFRTFSASLDAGMRGRIGYPDGSDRSFAAPSWPPRDVPGCGRIRDALDVQTSDQRPMTCVDWHTAQAFCVFEGGRLPTSAEWELVAHGRGGGAQTTRYPWGDSPPSTESCVEAWFSGCEADDDGLWPQGVGALTAGVARDALGPKVFDLSGNAAEWTADRYESFAVGNCWPAYALVDPSCPFEAIDAAGAALPAFVITRGGAIARVDSADDGVTSLYAAAVVPRSASAVSPYVGFRCVYDHAL